MKKIISGIQATGQPTLGNYLGAFKPQISMQDEADVTYFIADLHSITVRQKAADLRNNTYAIAAWYLACGLDIEKSNLFVQSHVNAHAQLAWVLNTFAMMGELERMTQFKDKSKRNNQNINVGLFAYPVLQAADILLYQVDEVPVGEDQKQHIELTRDIAIRFNNHYMSDDKNSKPIFTIPKAVLPKVGARVKDLQDPMAKMSKSVGGKGTIFLEEDLNVIAKKIKSAVTDSDNKIVYDKTNKPGISNLLEIYAVTKNISIDKAVLEFDGKSYGEFKQNVADCLIADLEPVKERYNQLIADKGELDRILKLGSDKASYIAYKTLNKVMKKVGFVPPIR